MAFGSGDPSAPWSVRGCALVRWDGLASDLKVVKGKLYLESNPRSQVQRLLVIPQPDFRLQE